MPNARGELKAEGAVSKPVGRYGALKKALSQYHRQRQALQHAEWQLAKCRERQLCLLDLVLHQELCLDNSSSSYDGVICEEQDDAQAASLEQPGPLDNGRYAVSIDADTKSAYDSADGKQHTRQPTAVPGAGAQHSATALKAVDQPGTQQIDSSITRIGVSTGSSSTVGATPACSYVAGLLQTATDGDIHRVLTLETADWPGYWNQLFIKLVIHLELADRVPAVNSRTGHSLSEQSGTERVDRILASPEHDALLPTNPADSLQQLHVFTDTVVRDVVLAFCYNHLPLLKACTSSCTDGKVQTPPPGHWEAVVKRLQLTNTQVLHIVIAYEEYARLLETAAKPCTELLSSSTNRLSSLLEAMQFENHSTEQQTEAKQPIAAVATPQNAQQQQRGDQDGSISSGVDGVQGQLQRHMRNSHLLLRMLTIFVVNTLSRLQLVQMIVGSFPHLPAVTVIARVVTADFYNRQHQQNSQVDDGEDDEDKELVDGLPRQQQQQQQQWSQSTPSAQLRAVMQRDIEQHVQERRELLQQQHTRWWQEQQQAMHGDILEMFL